MPLRTTLASVLLAVGQLAGSLAANAESAQAITRRSLLSDGSSNAARVGFALMPVMFILGAALGAVATWMMMKRKLAKHCNTNWLSPGYSRRRSSDDILISKPAAAHLDKSISVCLNMQDDAQPQTQTSTPTAEPSNNTAHAAEPSVSGKGTPTGTAGKGHGVVNFTVTMPSSSDSADTIRNPNYPAYALNTDISLPSPPSSPNQAPSPSKTSSQPHSMHAPTSPKPVSSPTGMSTRSTTSTEPNPVPILVTLPAVVTYEERPSVDMSGRNLTVHSKPRAVPAFTKSAPAPVVPLTHRPNGTSQPTESRASTPTLNPFPVLTTPPVPEDRPYVETSGSNAVDTSGCNFVVHGRPRAPPVLSTAAPTPAALRIPAASRPPKPVMSHALTPTINPFPILPTPAAPAATHDRPSLETSGSNVVETFGCNLVIHGRPRSPPQLSKGFPGTELASPERAPTPTPTLNPLPDIRPSIDNSGSNLVVHSRPRPPPALTHGAPQPATPRILVSSTKPIPIPAPDNRPSIDTSGNNLVVHSRPRGMPLQPEPDLEAGWSATRTKPSISKVDAARAALMAPNRLSRSHTAASPFDGPHSTGAPSLKGMSEHHMLTKVQVARSATLDDDELEGTWY